MKTIQKDLTLSYDIIQIMNHKFKETCIAQIGAGLMVVGFAVQIIGNVFQ